MNLSHHPPADWASRPGCHSVSLSGGKDSTALVIYLRDDVPQRTWGYWT